MKVGAIYPQTELGGDIGAVKAFAQAAEEMGYDHLVIYDHVLGADHAGRDPKLRGPYENTDPFHEPLITYAYLAGVTERIELVTGVLVLPQRQTALVAKQAADVDLFSGGRLRLGVGVGWNWVEFDALELPDTFKKRGRRQEAQIELMRKLWGNNRSITKMIFIGLIGQAFCLCLNGRSRSGSAARARSHMTAQRGWPTGFFFPAVVRITH